MWRDVTRNTRKVCWYDRIVRELEGNVMNLDLCQRRWCRVKGGTRWELWAVPVLIEWKVKEKKEIWGKKPHTDKESGVMKQVAPVADLLKKSESLAFSVDENIIQHQSHRAGGLGKKVGESMICHLGFTDRIYAPSSAIVITPYS